MKHTFSLLAIAAIFFISISARGSRQEYSNERALTHSPSLEITVDDTTVALDDYKGQYLLLTFWSSADAESRVRCNEYQQLLRQQLTDVAMLSINFDESDALYHELLSYDHLNQGVNLHADEQLRSQLADEFNLGTSLKSFLIDPSGRIEAINPATDYLTTRG